MSYTHWARLLRFGRLGIAKAKKRDGLCDYCMQWDEQDKPGLATSMKAFMKEVEALEPGYFHGWEKIEACFEEPYQQKETKPSYWKAFMAFLDEKGNSTNKGVRAALRKYMKELGVHIMKVVKGFNFHLQLWRVQTDALDFLLNNIPVGHIIFISDVADR